MGVAAGMEFDHRGAEAQGGVDLALAGLDEQADPDARPRSGGRRTAADARAGRRRRARPRWSAPRAFRARCRRRWGGGASAIASISSVAAISRFSGRSISAISRSMSSSVMWRRSSRRWAVIPSAPASAATMRGAHRIGEIAAARIPDGRDMVDVDAEAERCCVMQAARLPGLTAGIAASSGGTESAA